MRFYLYDPHTLEFRELEGRVIVGRDRGDWIFPRVGELSSEHVRFRVEGDRVFVEDLGSTNGVRVEGERLPPLEERELRLFERVRFGPKEWVLCDSDQRIPRAPSPPRKSAAPVPAPELHVTPPMSKKLLRSRAPSRFLRPTAGLLLAALCALAYDAHFLVLWHTWDARGLWTLAGSILLMVFGISQFFARHAALTQNVLAFGIGLTLVFGHYTLLHHVRFAFSPQALLEERACPSLLVAPLLSRVRPVEHALLQDACRIRKLKHALEDHPRLFCGERGAGFDCFRESEQSLRENHKLTPSGEAALFFLGAFWIRRDYQSNAVSLLKTTGRAVEWLARAVRSFADPQARAGIRPALLPFLVGPGIPASLPALAPALTAATPAVLTEEDGPLQSLRKLFGLE